MKTYFYTNALACFFSSQDFGFDLYASQIKSYASNLMTFSTLLIDSYVEQNSIETEAHKHSCFSFSNIP